MGHGEVMPIAACPLPFEYDESSAVAQVTVRMGLPCSPSAPATTEFQALQRAKTGQSEPDGHELRDQGRTGKIGPRCKKAKFSTPCRGGS